MIYEFSGPAPDVGNVNIFRLLPEHGWAVWIFAVGAVLLAAACLQKRSRIPGLAAASVLFAGMFVYLYRITDEVSVNLEHAYNLFHYGRFSMSRDAMVDGTVEWFFYLLHTPFAANQTTLVLGNFLISFAVAWLHLFVIWRMKLFSPDRLEPFKLSIFSLTLPLIGLLSGGFGNGLVSLVFLMGMLQALQGKWRTSLIWTAFLPLLRPEGVIWAMLNAAAVALISWRERSGVWKSRSFMGLACLPLLACALQLGLNQLMYGHIWLTPVLFKRTALNPFDAFTLEYILRRFEDLAMTYPVVVLAIIATAVCFIMDTMMRKGRVTIPPFRALPLALIVYLGLTAISLVFWVRTGLRYAVPTDRYYLVFFMCMYLCALVSMESAGKFAGRVWEAYVPRLPAIGQGMIWGLALAAVCGLFAFFTLDTTSWKYNRIAMAKAGAWSEKILPQGWTIASSELNTYGLMIERPVIDLWGYSNRQIAGSNTCNVSVNIKTDPEYFLAARPDVYFMYYLSEFPEQYTYEDVDSTAALSAYSHLAFGLLGNAAHIYDVYDIAVLNFEKMPLAFLIRRDRMAEFTGALKKSGITLSRSRPITPELLDYLKAATLELHNVYRCGQ